MSKPQVTITLGRTGQVVTKGGKRSRGERFGGNRDSFFLSAKKRHRGDGMKWTPGLQGVNGSRIARNDLRLKLMRKRLSKPIQNVAEEREKMDPHNRLSNAIQPPMSSYMLPHGPDPNRSNPSRRILPKGIANDLHQVDSMGTFYSTHNMGGPRVRSPERIFKSSSGLLPPRSYDEMRPKTWRRETEVSRGGWSLSSEVPEHSRPRGSTPVTMKTASYAGNLVTRVSPTTGIMQMLPHVGEEPLTVGGFLQSLDLGKYAISFQAEEVDMTVLKQMGDNDLKEMGIPMGPRKKILLALLPPSKRQTSRLQH